MKLPVNGGRRQRLRFPLSLRAELAFQGNRFSGLISNFGSGGVYILTKEVFPVGKAIRLLIEWPALLDGRCPLTLFVLGYIVRRDDEGVAVRISKHEFRLRASKTPKETRLRVTG